jgi:hypothetical protein
VPLNICRLCRQAYKLKPDAVTLPQDIRLATKVVRKWRAILS